jgi:hypothetical protein
VPKGAEPLKNCRCGAKYTWRGGSVFQLCPGIDFQVLLFELQNYADCVGEGRSAKATEIAHTHANGDLVTQDIGQPQLKNRISNRTVSKFYDRLTEEWLKPYNEKYWEKWGGVGGLLSLKLGSVGEEFVLITN